MFDWIKDLLHWLGDRIIPFQVVSVYDGAVRLRFGKHPKILTPGLRFKIPLADYVYTCNIKNETKETKAVHVTTVCGKTVTAVPIIKFRIVDPVKWLIESCDADNNLAHITAAVVSDCLTDITWEECKKKTTRTVIRKKLNDTIEDMGAKVSDVMLTDLCICRVIITAI